MDSNVVNTMVCMMGKKDTALALEESIEEYVSKIKRCRQDILNYNKTIAQLMDGFDELDGEMKQYVKGVTDGMHNNSRMFVDTINHIKDQIILETRLLADLKRGMVNG